MILIITHKTDFTADFVVNKLNQRGISYRRFNCEDILLKEFSFKFSNDFEYSLLNEHNYESVWFRRTKLPDIQGLPNEEKIYVLSEIDGLFKNIFSALPAKWLSPPVSVYQAENKLLQLKTAKRIGFKIPTTLITNSKRELKSFYNENGQDIIIKPLSQTRVSNDENAAFIFTNVVPQNLIDQLKDFDLTPCIFQRNIPKEYEVRVTVVGEKVFAAAVYSQSDEEAKIDWRRKRLVFNEVHLPDEIKNLCVQILRELNLGFGAIDLIKTPEGEYVFLEINPNGQWVWIENQTGQRISEAIIEYLTNENE